MQEQERVFISYMEDSHPVLKEMPEEFRDLWFHGYTHPATQNTMFLQMERIFNKRKEFIDVLTIEIADEDTILEWEEDFPDKKFVAIAPYHTFFDGMDKDRAMFSLGDIDIKTMVFEPELEIYITPHPEGILVDFQEGDPELYKKSI